MRQLPVGLDVGLTTVTTIVADAVTDSIVLQDYHTNREEHT